MREPEEPWVNAITRRLQKDNAPKPTEDKGRAVYLMEIIREESDADSDVQEEQGWKSGAATIAYTQAGGVDRPKRVSREARREVQTNVPQRARMMNKLSKERNME